MRGLKLTSNLTTRSHPRPAPAASSSRAAATAAGHAAQCAVNNPPHRRQNPSSRTPGQLSNDRSDLRFQADCAPLIALQQARKLLPERQPLATDHDAPHPPNPHRQRHPPPVHRDISHDPHEVAMHPSRRGPASRARHRPTRGHRRNSLTSRNTCLPTTAFHAKEDLFPAPTRVVRRS
jgi:hypothetical protein